MALSAFSITLILAFVRTTVFLYQLPMLKSNYIPNIAKLTFALAISYLAIGRMPEIQVNSVSEFILMIIAEVAIGFTLGYVVNTLFMTFSVAGTFIGNEMGLGNGQILDPTSGTQQTPVSNMYNLLFFITFVQMKGFNLLIFNLAYSFQFYEYRFFFGEEKFVIAMLSIATHMLLLSLQIALPFMGAMFMMNIFLLILQRTAPQVNIFANMFPIKIAVGFILIYATLPLLGKVFMSVSEDITIKHEQMIRLIFNI